MFLPAQKSSIAKHRKYRPDITDDFCNKAATMSTQLNFIDEKVKKTTTDVVIKINANEATIKQIEMLK